MTITAKAAADILTVSIERIHVLRKRGTIGVKVGDKMLIDIELVYAYKQSRKTGRPSGSYKV